MCLWRAHQGVITRQYWSDELQAVISLFRLRSASRSVSSLMLLSTPTSPTVNLTARPADAITHTHTKKKKSTHVHMLARAHTQIARRAPYGQAPAKVIEHRQGLVLLSFIKVSPQETEMLTLALLVWHLHGSPA